MTPNCSPSGAEVGRCADRPTTALLAFSWPIVQALALGAARTLNRACGASEKGEYAEFARAYCKIPSGLWRAGPAESMSLVPARIKIGLRRFIRSMVAFD